MTRADFHSVMLATPAFKKLEAYRKKNGYPSNAQALSAIIIEFTATRKKEKPTPEEWIESTHARLENEGRSAYGYEQGNESPTGQSK